MPRRGRAARARRRNAKIARETLALREAPLRADTRLNGLRFAFSVIVNGRRRFSWKTISFLPQKVVFTTTYVKWLTRLFPWRKNRLHLTEVRWHRKRLFRWMDLGIIERTGVIVSSTQWTWSKRRSLRFLFYNALPKHTPPRIRGALRIWKFTAVANLEPNALTIGGSLAIAMTMTALCEAYLQRRVPPGLNSSTRILRWSRSTSILLRLTTLFTENWLISVTLCFVLCIFSLTIQPRKKTRLPCGTTRRITTAATTADVPAVKNRKRERKRMDKWDHDHFNKLA